MKNIWLMVVVMFISACTDERTTERVLEESGFSNVKVTGYDFFGCSEDDPVHTGFVATGPTGRTVEGVVCSSYFW